MAFGLSAGATSLISAVAPSVIGALTADEAAGVQQGATQQAGGLTAAQYQDVVNRITPYSRSGGAANNKLASLLGLEGYQSTEDAVTQAYRQNLGRNPVRSELQLWKQYETQGLTPDEIANAIATSPEAVQNAGRVTYTPGPNEDNSGEFGALLKKYTGADLLNDPAYKFRVSEGQKGIERSAAGRGGLFSGQAGKELERFRQGLASTEFDKAFARDASSKNQMYGMLSGQSAQGLGAETTIANAGMNSAQRQGDYLTQGANAEAAGMVGGANAITSGFGNFQNYNLLNSMFNKAQTSGGSSEPYPGYNAQIGFR